MGPATWEQTSTENIRDCKQNKVYFICYVDKFHQSRLNELNTWVIHSGLKPVSDV